MDYIFRAKSATCSDDSSPRRQLTNFCNDALALLQYRRAACTMNGAIHSPTAQQCRVCGVNDCFGYFFGDVSWTTKFDPLAARQHEANGEIIDSGILQH
jgi:hypothetical protein